MRMIPRRYVRCGISRRANLHGIRHVYLILSAVLEPFWLGDYIVLNVFCKQQRVILYKANRIVLIIFIYRGKRFGGNFQNQLKLEDLERNRSPPNGNGDVRH